jgi:hypothetical protein
MLSKMTDFAFFLIRLRIEFLAFFYQFILTILRYTITLRHGEFNWTITKKYKDLVIFFERMNVFQKTAALPIPTTSYV